MKTRNTIFHTINALNKVQILEY